MDGIVFGTFAAARVIEEKLRCDDEGKLYVRSQYVMDDVPYSYTIDYADSDITRKLGKERIALENYRLFVDTKPNIAAGERVQFMDRLVDGMTEYALKLDYLQTVKKGLKITKAFEQNYLYGISEETGIVYAEVLDNLNKKEGVIEIIPRSKSLNERDVSLALLSRGYFAAKGMNKSLSGVRDPCLVFNKSKALKQKATFETSDVVVDKIVEDLAFDSIEEGKVMVAAPRRVKMVAHEMVDGEKFQLEYLNNGARIMFDRFGVRVYPGRKTAKHILGEDLRWRKHKIDTILGSVTGIIKSLIKQGNTIELIDRNRRRKTTLFTKDPHKKEWFQMVRIAHNAKGANAAWDIRKDSLIRTLCKIEPKELEEYIDNTLIMSANICRGWSGVLLHKEQVVDYYNVNWSEEGWCVVQGRDSDGRVTNALIPGDYLLTVEFYAPNYYRTNLKVGEQRFGEHSRLIEMRLEQILNEVRRVQTETYGLNSIEVWRLQLEREIIKKWSIKFISIRGFIEHMEKLAIRHNLVSNFKYMVVGGTNEDVWSRFKQTTFKFDPERKNLPSLPTWGFGKFGPNTTGFLSLGDNPDLCWKNGYCYIWIFYSMVNQAIVKNYVSFTQRILEKIEQLGEFPLMKYVVAHCYDLMKEFPGLEWIPMPRIWKTNVGGIPMLHAVATDGIFGKESDRCQWWYLIDMIEFFTLENSLIDVVIGGLSCERLTKLVKLIPKPEEFIQECNQHKNDFVDMVTTPNFSKGFNKLPFSLQDSLLQACLVNGNTLSDILAVIQRFDVPCNYADNFVNHLSLVKHYCRIIQEHTADEAIQILINKRVLDIDTTLEEKKDLDRLQFVGAREQMEKNYDVLAGRLLKDLYIEHVWFGRGREYMFSLERGLSKLGRDGYETLSICGSKCKNAATKSVGFVASTMWMNLYSYGQMVVAQIALRTGVAAFFNKYKITLSVSMILFGIVTVVIWLVSKLRVMVQGPTQHVNINFQPNYNSRNAPIEQFAPVHIEGTKESYFTPAEIPVDGERIKAVVQSGHKSLFRFGALVVLITALWDYSQSDAMFSVLMKLNSIHKLLMSDDTRAVVQAGDDDEFDEQMEIVGTSNRIVELLLKPVQPEVTTYDEMHNFKAHFDEVLVCGPALKLEYHGKEVKSTDRSGIPGLVEYILRSDEKRFIVEGRVGCGKSTYLPHLLAEQGKVLICENSRALTMNVARNLSDDFHESVTVKMGGHSIIGYGNITVATSGYVYHAYSSHVGLNEYKFIIIDECHLLSTDVLVLKALLQSRFKGKLIECSATPIGMKVPFTTNEKVTTFAIDDLPFEDIPKHFGKGTKYDVTCNLHEAKILIYVSSYNEVDVLVKIFLKNNIQCIGIDGRKEFSVGDVRFPGGAGHSVIVATNIIENGVTIEANVVVDFGNRVQAVYDDDQRAIIMQKVRISNAERHQRKGRVGRKEEGFAIVVGKTQGNDFSVSRISLTESAAISFALRLPSVVEGVDNEYFSNCSRAQIVAAMNYELPLMFSCYLFDSEGRTTVEIYNSIKQTVRYNQQQKLVSNAISSVQFAKWRSLNDYVKTNSINSEELKLYAEEATWTQLRIPLYTNNVSVKLMVNVAKAIREGFKVLSYKTTRQQTEQLSLLLEQDRYNVDEVKAYLRSRLNECKQKLNAAKELPIGSSSTWLSGILPNCISKVRGRYIADLTGNIKTLTEAIQQIEIGHVRLELNAKSRDEYIKENPQMCLCAVIQCNERNENEKYDEVSEILSLRGVYKWRLIFRDMVFCVGVAIMMALFIWNTFERKKPTRAEVEGKGNRFRRINKGMKEWSLLSGDDSYMQQELTKSKKKYKAQISHDPVTRKRRIFSMFYGDDIENVNRFQVLNPMDGSIVEHGKFDQFNADSVWKKIQSVNAGKSGPVGASEPRMEIVLFKAGLQEGIKRVLTPHDPLRVGNNGNVSGFDRYTGAWRQTGRGVPIQVIQTEDSLLNVDAEPFVPKGGVYWADILASEDEQLDEILATLEGKAVHKGNIRTDLIMNNMCVVYYGKMVVKGLLFGRVLIVPIHLMKEGPGHDILVQTKARGVLHLGFGSATFKFKQLHPSDIALIHLTEEIPPFSQGIKFRKPLPGESIRLLSCGFSKTTGFSYYTSAECVTKPLMGTLWEHTISTVQGLCGCPVQAVSDGFIIGFHSVALLSVERNGFTPISDDFLISIKMIDTFTSGKWKFNRDLIDWGSLEITNWKPLNLPCQIKSLKENEAEVQGGWVSDHVANGMLQNVAELQSNLVNKHVVVGRCQYFDRFIRCNPKLEILPLLGEYSPSALNQEAYRKDVLKYDVPVSLGKVDMVAYQKAEKFVEEIFTEVGIISLGSPARYIFDCEEISDRLKKDTALGAQYQGKKDVFLNLSLEEREKLFDESIMKVFRGSMGIWKTSLKAELRPTEKVNENKTRTFTAAPLESVLVGKVCVDEFNERFYDNHTKIPSTVGINKFNRGWHNLMEKLPDGWLYCCADGSRFDSSITPLLFNSVLKLRLAAMEESDLGEVLLRNLYTEIVYTPMSLADGNVCKKFRGNNSGQPSTVVDNTIVVMLAVYYSFFCQGYDGHFIRKNIVFFANGDDLLISMPPKFRNCLGSLKQFFSQLSLNYNFEAITNDKEEIEYMSHKALKRDGVWVPKLAKERIIAIVEWQKAKTTLGRHSALQAARVESFGYQDLSKILDMYQQFLLNTDFYDNIDEEEARVITFPSWVAIENLYLKECAQAEVQAGSDEEGIHEEAFMSAQTTMPPQAISPERAIESPSPEILQQSEVHSAETPRSLPPLEHLATGSSSGKDRANGTLVGESGGLPTEQLNYHDNQPFRTFQDETNLVVGNAVVTPGQRQDVLKSTQVQRAKGFISLPKDNIGRMSRLIPQVRGKQLIDPLKLVQTNMEAMELRSDQATDQQLEQWCEKIMKELPCDRSQIGDVLNAWLIWCISNGTTMQSEENWIMYGVDGEQQSISISPFKPIGCTLRQVMRRFSAVAEQLIKAKIAMGEQIPMKWAMERNLTNKAYMPCAFDFWVPTSVSSSKFVEIHHQMKAAAMAGTKLKSFGMDGNMANTEDTERHTIMDATPNIHHFGPPNIM